MAHKAENIYDLALYQKSLPTPASIHYNLKIFLAQSIFWNIDSKYRKSDIKILKLVNDLWNHKIICFMKGNITEFISINSNSSKQLFLMKSFQHIQNHSF